MNRTRVSGHPQLNHDFDATDADHAENLTSAASTLVTRRSPVNFGVLCHIDAVQREHAVRMHESMHSLAVDVGAAVARLVEDDAS